MKEKRKATVSRKKINDAARGDEMKKTALTACDSAVFISRTNASGKDSRKWFFLKIFAIAGFAGGFAAMTIGLTLCATVWAEGLQLHDSVLGAAATVAIILSFALAFGGAFCLDAIYDASRDEKR